MKVVEGAAKATAVDGKTTGDTIEEGEEHQEEEPEPDPEPEPSRPSENKCDWLTILTGNPEPVTIEPRTVTI